MKKLVLVVTVGLFLVGLIACGGGKYADARAAAEEMVELMNGFGNAIEKAEDGKAVVTAIENFADKFKASQKKMEELTKKYPDLKNQVNPPEELKDLMPKLDEAGKKMMGAMTKIMQFASDPEVAKALEKMKAAR